MLTTIPSEAAAANQGINAGADSRPATSTWAASSTPVNLDKTTVLDFIVGCGQVLDEQNISDEGRWLRRRRRVSLR